MRLVITGAISLAIPLVALSDTGRHIVLMRDFPTLGDAIDHVTSDDHVMGDDWSVQIAHEAFGVLKSTFPNISHHRIRVLHNPNYFAFTADGHHIFLTRTLLEICASIEMAAFAIAHEIAHHELGHVPAESEGVRGRLKVAMLSLRHRVWPFARARMEIEADQFAIDMCIRAGLSVGECLRIFQILEKRTLDKGGIESAFGSYEFYDTEMSSFERRWKIGLYLLRHANYPIRIRRILAERHARINSTNHDVFLN